MVTHFHSVRREFFTGVVTAWLAASVLAQQPASPPGPSGKQQIYTMRGDYEIVAQGDGKRYVMHRLAIDGSIFDTLVLTKKGSKNGEIIYFDKNGSEYIQLSDGTLREERVLHAGPITPPTVAEARPQSKAQQIAPARQTTVQTATQRVVEPPPRPAVEPPPTPQDMPVGRGAVQAATQPAVMPRPPLVAPLSPEPYKGPMSGTLNCDGAPIPQNGEKVFANLPGGRLELHFDEKAWEARLYAGPNRTQQLVLKSKKPGLQRKCAVYWSVIP